MPEQLTREEQRQALAVELHATLDAIEAVVARLEQQVSEIQQSTHELRTERDDA